MIKCALLLLQIILAANATLTAKEFINIGSFRSQRVVLQESDQNFNEDSYYVSPSNNRVIWTYARQTCKNIFGDDAGIVAIETIEEWNFIKIMLESYGMIDTYWTSGIYDDSTNIWRWALNDEPIMTSAPWEEGHPSSNPNGLLRVLIYHANRYDASWRSVSNTQLHRFICEVPQATPDPITCIDTDLIIVLDSSASIGSHNYKKTKRFVAVVAKELIAHNTHRIGFLIYSDTVSSIINLDNILDPEELFEAILDAPYLKGSTATHEGINEAIKQFNNFPRNVTQNIVVLTDRESSNTNLTASAIEMAEGLGIRTFFVGISPSADRDELLVITNGEADYVFQTNKCDDLISLSVPLIRKICPDADN